MAAIRVEALAPRYWANCGGKLESPEESHTQDVGMQLQHSLPMLGLLHLQTQEG
jgi:hypothetical protein